MESVLYFGKVKKLSTMIMTFGVKKDWQEDMKRDAEKSGKICQGIEDAGVEINFNNYYDFQRGRI